MEHLHYNTRFTEKSMNTPAAHQDQWTRTLFILPWRTAVSGSLDVALPFLVHQTNESKHSNTGNDSKCYLNLLSTFESTRWLSLSSPSMFSILVCWTSLTSDKEGVEEGVGAGDKSGEGDGEDSKANGGADGDNACGDGATSSVPFSGAGAGNNSGGSTTATNSTKSNTEVSAMKNLNNLAIAKSSLRGRERQWRGAAVGETALVRALAAEADRQSWKPTRGSEAKQQEFGLKRRGVLRR